MKQGITDLLSSKKGLAFSSSAASLLLLIVEGGLPVVIGAKLLAGLTGIHIISQGAVDIAKALGSSKKEIPKNALDPKTGL